MQCVSIMFNVRNISGHKNVYIVPQKSEENNCLLVIYFPFHKLSDADKNCIINPNRGEGGGGGAPAPLDIFRDKSAARVGLAARFHEFFP